MRAQWSPALIVGFDDSRMQSCRYFLEPGCPAPAGAPWRCLCFLCRSAAGTAGLGLACTAACLDPWPPPGSWQEEPG